MYTNPITIIVDQMTAEAYKREEQEIIRCVQRIGVNVDRDELIKALSYDREQYEKGYADGHDDAMPRWIPVEERLPEAHKHVLIHVTNPIGWWNTEIDWMDEQGWVRSNADSEWHHITHWMPLPEPPKEE